MFRSLVLLLVLAVTEPVSAQPRGAAVVDFLAGIEGGGRNYAAGVRRTRTTMRIGLAGWLEQAPMHMLAAAAVIEIEPVAAVGADLRYQLRFLDDFVAHLGVTSILSAGPIVGASTGLGYQVAIAEHFGLSFGPTANVYFAGEDLADDVILWQVMMGAGGRAWF